MAGNPFTVTLGTVTFSSIEISTTGGPEDDPWVFDLYEGSSASGTIIDTVTGTTGNYTCVFTGLSPSTTYTIRVHSDENPDYDATRTTTTLSNNPKTATEGQWQDLVDKIKAKSDSKIAMTNTDPGEGAPLAANNFIAVYGGTSINLDYSVDSEINTGTKWINGSAIYKKTINFGALPNASTKAVAHNISGLSTIVNIEGVVLSGGVYQPLNFYDGASIRVAYVGATTVNFYTTNDQSGATAYITLYYTKSS